MKYLLMFLLVVGFAFGATKNFDDGGVDSNWTTKENWSDDTLPEPGDDVVILNGNTCVMDVATISGSTSTTVYAAGGALNSITNAAGGNGTRPRECYHLRG